ncbi:MAG: hypothetical protein J6R22_03415 [Alphaproteobacteria bacterium]|nr:hypothetical protein [Alphaproteobacteria bacterium]
MAKNKIDPELMAEYRRYAKRADQRLVRLEKLAESGDTNYQGVLSYSYKKAAQDAKKWGSTGERPRFNVKPPETAGEIKAKIKDIEAFLESPTSTKKGITDVYKKRAETFNKRFGKKGDRPVTWQELANYYKSDQAKALDKRYGSKTIARAVRIASNAKSKLNKAQIQDLQEAVKQARAKGQNWDFLEQRTAGDKQVNAAVNAIIAGEKIEKKTPAKKSYMQQAVNDLSNPNAALRRETRRAARKAKRNVKKNVKKAVNKVKKSKKQRQKARAKKRKNRRRK